MSSTKNLRSTIEQIQREVERDPSSGLKHRDRLRKWVVHDDSRVRYGALDVMIKMSASYPLQLREQTPGIVSRLDDESEAVRGGALAVVYNLARWYPQEFGHTTELLHELLRESDLEKERGMAAGAVSRIAVLRPDLVTPREAIRESLVDFLERPDAEAVLDSCDVDSALVETAIDVLDGGDMASRPLEADLAPTPRTTGLSKPAQIGLRSIVWGAAIPLLFYIAILNALRFAYRFQHLSPMGRGKVMLHELRKLKFFGNRARRALYLRASMWPTATQIFPFLPGRAPVSEDIRQQTPPLPDDWGIRASVVRQRDGYYCRNCGVGGGPNGDAELHVDHQTPRSVGGSDDPENLRTLCRECHEARHARVFDA
ncbi:HNH endonuclease [Natrarchaeobius oligotrophus]|uniref:HNH endonuclease n=1 Tax=Natrarchaeobius chitinivorans TaxID=1679083 RepID=A0A3N6MYK3_NATCH|nr:HNH endonuclease signature motif containing protein [Natrarchaeobius chitinivorans]RQH03181.1 HNH endonuclease [Natrarchaeobius chitinivorans]